MFFQKASFYKQLSSVVHAAFLMLIFSFELSIAQVNPPNNEQQVEDRIERAAETGDETVDYDELKQILDEYSQRPINLNRTSKEQLQLLGLLNDFQIENLLAHIQKNGDLIALQELQTINGFESDDIQRILPYVKITTDINAPNMSFAKYLSEGTNQVLIRCERVLSEQAGYNPVDSNDSQYLGSPYRIYLRYKLSYQRKYSFGIVGEKDPGEEFFSGNKANRGFDYYSAHLFIRDIKKIRSIALGDYQVEYGQGLTVWSGLAFGKSADPASVIRFAGGLRPYTSVNETQFRRGAAISVQPIKYLFVDGYFSFRKVDGNAATIDSLNQIGDFSSLQTSGMHRTESEIADQGIVEVTSYGGHVAYRKRRYEIGFTAAATQFDKPLVRTTSLYNQFQFSGDHFFNTGVDYKFLYRNLSFFGETSHSKNGAFATVNGVIMALDPKLTTTLLYRNYSKKYEAIESNAIAESDNFNEKGMYFGFTAKPVRMFTLSGYFDIFSYPWLRYQVNSPSKGFEYIAQLTFTPNKRLEIYVRQKQTSKQENVSIEDAPPIDYNVNVNQYNSRLNIAFRVSNSVTLRNRIEFVKYNKQLQSSETGFLIYQDILYKPLIVPVSFSLRYALFDTKSYNSRLYAYENDVYGAYSIPPLAYKGSRFYLLVRWTVVKHIDIFVRYSQTVYDNQETIGSGLDQINSNVKSDIKAVVKLEF